MVKYLLMINGLPIAYRIFGILFIFGLILFVLGLTGCVDKEFNEIKRRNKNG